MRFLASYASKGRWQAVTVAAVTALLTPLLLPLSLLSGGVVSLITLKVGALQGLQLIGLAMLAVLAVSLFLPPPLSGGALALTVLMLIWLPVWALAVNLRRSADQGRSVLLASLLGVMVVLVFHLGTDSPAEWWQGFALEYFAPVSEQLSPAERLQFEENITQTAGIMTGISAMGLSLSLLLSLMLGRWWQATLVNPGGFGEEFRALRIGRKPTLIILLVVVAAMLSGAMGLGQDLLMVLMLPFLLQGMSLVHALVKKSGANRGWLVAMYVLLVFAGPIALLLAVAGALDNWFDFRAYADPRGGAGDS